VKQAQRTRVTVVGTGPWWGREHARVWAERPDVDLCAVVGRTPERAAARAREFGANPYVDLGEMLEREQPDLVSLCLANEGHFEPTLEVIRAGGLGELVFATWRFGGEPGTSSHPHANLIETQCHGLDMLEYLCGPIDSVTAQMTDKTGRGYSTLVVTLHFANGAVGSLVGSYDSSYAYPATYWLELNGTSGRILVEDTVRRYTFTQAGSEVSSVWQAGYFNDADRGFHRTFDKHVDDLLPAFRNAQAPPIHARAGRRALAVALAIIDSFETGTRVDVPPSADTARS
jgi:myo-inositol 2-dehydrogenase / D-chiro-inositol 1-dehydrogenase